ncbi:MAG: M20/M25/M40 family metallo-hydrolase [Bifidobacteriaceae bacterium]|jgi:acetylornithine deacetylase/succinyl-diaminopimelate desuccinylase-like protein|nr:M20/M25/M40 family metallo-hydrolase [Bifidobacteriaceae bacterium]
MISPSVIAARVAAQFPDAVAALKALVRIPSYAGDSAPPGVLDRSAAEVVRLLESVGAQDVEVVSAGGGPAVIGHLDVDPNVPTVLLYAHHDVQPVAADWSTDPWTPVEKAGRLYGRGAADDGAGIVTHIGALRALGEDLRVNVRFFIEGEEESGSPTMDKMLDTYRDRLDADLVVVADSDNKAVDTPSLTVSLRGLAELTVTLRVAHHAIHSGMCGGVFLEAPMVLAKLLATLHDDEGAVAVPGLVATGTSPVQLSEAELRQNAGLVDGLKLAGRGSLADRLWWQPSITLIGFDSTTVADSSNTIQPVARAKLSIRVPPGMNPTEAQAAVRRHLESKVLFNAELTIEDGVVGEGFVADQSGPGFNAAAAALADAFGVPAVPLGQGGSIPLAAELTATFPDMEVLLTGVEDPDSRAHSGDESVSLAMLEKVIVAEALLLDRLADQRRDAAG